MEWDAIDDDPYVTQRRSTVPGEPRKQPNREKNQTIRLAVDLEDGAGQEWDLEKGRKAELRTRTYSISKEPFGQSSVRFWFYSARRSSDDPTHGSTVELLAHETRSDPKLEANHVWHHVQEESMSFDGFIKKAIALAVPDQDYAHLVRSLLETVQRSSEKTFVHGRFLKPVTATSQSKEHALPKRVTFFCLPFFSLETQKDYNTDKHFPGHPVRSLMQWIYRLESTKQRDAIQVSAARSEHGKIIRVPDMWALALGKRVLLTRASVSREEIIASTVKIVSVPKNPENQDHAVVNILDSKKNMFYIPLSRCQTFYELLSNIRVAGAQIPEVGRSRLHRRHRAFRLSDHAGSDVHERSWVDILRKNRSSPMLRLRIHAVKRAGSRTAVDANTGSGSEASSSPQPVQLSDGSEYSSSVIEMKGGRSSFDSYNSTPSREISELKSTEAELQAAYRRLELARDNDIYEDVSALQLHQIPDLETRLIEELDRAYEGPVESAEGPRPRSPRHNHSRDDASDLEEQQRYNRFDERHQRRQRTKIARNNDLVESTVRGGLSDIASLDAVELRRGRGSSDESDSQDGSPVVAPIYSHVIRGNFTKADKGRRRRPREHHMQYIPPKKSINSAIRMALGEPAMGHPGAQKDQRGSIRIEARQSAAHRSNHETDGVRRRVQKFLRKGHKSVPFFSWPLGFTIKSGTAERAAANIQKSVDRGPELDPAKSTAIDERSAIDSIRKQLLMSIILEDIHNRCRPTSSRYQRNLGNKILYKKAGVSSLARVATLVKSSDGAAQRSGIVPNLKRTLFLLTKRLLVFFVPSEMEADVIGKYWGAVYCIVASGRVNANQLATMLKELLRIAQLIQDLQSGSLDSSGNVPSVYRMPKPVPMAFRCLLFYIIFTAGTVDRPTEDDKLDGLMNDKSPNRSHFAEAQIAIAFKQCKAALRATKHQIPSMISSKRHSSNEDRFELISGEDIAMLMLANLQNQLLTEQGDFLLTDIYTEYATKMQYHVSKKAGVKVYEDINRFREEIEAIKSVLNQQYHRLLDLRGILFRPTTKDQIVIPSQIEWGRKYESTMMTPDTVRHHTTERLLQQVEQRRDNFDELLEQADRIQSRAAQSISLKAESNNRAIVIFTIVTVVFLPLSFVTSYFGMNTSDLRDMGSGQWLFWAIGTPLAVIVVLLTLVIGYFERLSRRLTSLLRQGDRQKID